MLSHDTQLLRLTTWFAAIVALIVSIAPPVAFSYHAYLHDAGELEAEAEFQAYLVTRIIGGNPVNRSTFTIPLRRWAVIACPHRGKPNRSQSAAAPPT